MYSFLVIHSKGKQPPKSEKKHLKNDISIYERSSKGFVATVLIYATQGQKLDPQVSIDDISGQKMNFLTNKCYFSTRNVIFDQKKGACGHFTHKKLFFSKKKRRLRPVHTQKVIFFQKKRGLRPVHTRKIFISKKNIFPK